MITRPYWHGHIRLSLVSLPVRLYLAIESKSDVTLRNIHKPTGARIHYQNIAHDIGPVSKEEIVKGYEHEKGQYVLLEPQEDDIDPIYFERPYYVVPDGTIAEEAFIVIREALRSTERFGIGQIVLGGREHLGALRAYENGMVLETIHYASELRRAQDYFGNLRERDVNADKLAMATELIARKSTPFDTTLYQDNYRLALEELIRSKLESRAPNAPQEPPAPGNVVNLMDALKRSLEAA